MRHLGKLSGGGTLKCDGQEVARASYDFDGFLRGRFDVTCSGEIRLAAEALKRVFARRGVQLLTDDGRLLDLRFSARGPQSATDVAYVDVSGELPTTRQGWHQ